MKEFASYFLIGLIAVSALTHLLKVVYLLFKPEFLKPYKVFSNVHLSKTSLLLYYLLTIAVSLFAIAHKVKGL
jgi:hypothetical protein